jgi:molybdopterin/thiamine biosynthesis adenylyltransferase
LIKPGKILMIGAGGLGCGTALALLESPPFAQGEPGKLTEIILVDPDRVALSNLHRQILYTVDDLEKPKVVQGAQHLTTKRADLSIRAVVDRLQGIEEIKEAAQGCELIVDGSDNFTTRFFANDAALALGIPLIHGAAIGFRGQLMTIIPDQSACLRCLFDGPPGGQEEASCRSEGVLGPLVGEVGWLMGMEVVKILWQAGTPLTNQLLTIDAQRQRRRVVPLRRRADCPGCG